MDPRNVGYTEDTTNLSEISGCIATTEQWYPSYFGIKLAIPEWEAIITAIILTVIIVLTIIGNVLVILSVFTYKPLRIVQNFFIVSLAVADLTVAVLVLPFNVAYAILGRWEFGIYLCKMWLTCDVMCCTSSILNLCAIALDRYWAITDPINYAQKRTVGRVLLLIAGVWLLSLLISSPPLVGWNDWPDEFTSATPCELNSDPGYVIYSALGSFYIPLVIMTMVYLEIFIATRRRLRKRAQVSKLHAAVPPSISINTVNRSTTANSKFNAIPAIYRSSLCCNKQPESALQNDHDSVSSELHANNDKLSSTNDKQNRKSGKFKIKDSLQIGKTHVCATNVIDDDGSKSMQENSDTVKQEMSTESASDPKEEIEDCSGIINVVAGIDDENTSIKMPSSIEGIPVQTIPKVEPKPVAIHQFIEEKQKISLSKERRAARTLGIIMGVFVICWLPFFLMYVILPFCSSCCPTSRFKNFITWLGYINSVLNPIIYTIFNLDYRRAFKRLLGFNK